MSDVQATDAARRPAGRSHLYFIAAVLAGMILGGLLGGVTGRVIPLVELVADLFLAALKMMVVPLVISSIIHGVASLGDLRKLGRLGAGTVLYYVTTTLISVVIGMVAVNLIAPGEGVSTATAQLDDVAAYSFLDVVRGMIPSNLFAAMADGQILPLIFFSIFFAVALAMVGKKAVPLLRVVEGIFEVSMKMVRMIVWTAPVGVFALVATRVGASGGGAQFAAEIAALGYYVLTVLLGLLVHGAVVLAALVFFVGRRNPLRLVEQLAEPLILAFSTASSSATLPVTMHAVEERAGVDKRVGNFVLPLGATVNMDGTALYEAVAAVFVAQCYGIELGFSTQLIIVLTATLAAIGAAGIPHAGLVTLVMVLQAAGLPAEGIGLILAVDWFLDRCRTTVNVWGDSVGAVVLERLVGVSSRR